MITSSVGSLSGGHILSYLITLVDNKVPMKTYSALQDAEKQMFKLMNKAFVVDNLSASAFLNASGKSIKTYIRNSAGQAIRDQVFPI